MADKKQKEEERIHARKLASISHSLADRLAGIPSIRAAFNTEAHRESKDRANALLGDIRISAFEIAAADGPAEKDAKAQKMYAAMVERAEICASVALTVDQEGAEAFLVNIFKAAQGNDKYRDVKYPETLEKMGAPLLAKAARQATPPVH